MGSQPGVIQGCLYPAFPFQDSERVLGEGEGEGLGILFEKECWAWDSVLVVSPLYMQEGFGRRIFGRDQPAC